MKVLIAELLRYTKPFGRWMDIDRPITVEEVKQYLVEHPNPVLPSEDYWFNWVAPKLEHAREDHIQRIAYFVVNESTNPIYIDTMCQGLVDDGNHRLAAACIKGDKVIQISWSGMVDEMRLLFRRSCSLKLLNIDD